MPVVEGWSLARSVGLGRPLRTGDERTLAGFPSFGDPLSPGGTTRPPLATAGLLDALARRRSTRRWADEPVPVATVASLLDASLVAESPALAASLIAGAPLTVFVLCRESGPDHSIWRWDRRRRRLDRQDSSMAAHEMRAAVLQVEFAVAPVVVSLWGDLGEACRSFGGQGHAQLLVRSGFAAESLWLEAVAAGLVGCIFAGLLASSLEGLREAAGPTAVPLLSLALGHPRPDAA